MLDLFKMAETDFFSENIPRYMDPLFDKSKFGSELQKIALELDRDGYAIFRFPSEDIDWLCTSIIDELSGEYDFRAKQKDPGFSMRSQDALHIDAVRSVSCNNAIIDMLSEIYGKKAFPFQTLNFPMGTQQRSHSDHIHFDSVPHGFMVGVWMALEDIDLDQGPLFYYPGSHKWPRLDNMLVGYDQDKSVAPHYARFPDVWDAIAENTGIKKQAFVAKRGDCLIWTANLVHGGMPQIDLNKTRWSQVTHYFFEGCGYYTPVFSNEFSNKIHWRSPLNISKGLPVESKIFGREVSFFNSALDFSDFDGNEYLDLHADVKKAGLDPYKHFVHAGLKEGRRYKTTERGCSPTYYNHAKGR